MRRTATALALAALTSLPLTTSWNIGGHSPVKDLTQENVVNAAKYAMNEGAESLHLPDNNGAGWTIGDSACDCEGCACIVSATKQVVAGMNWVLVLKLIPVGKENVGYRRVTVYDQSFAGTFLLCWLSLFVVMAFLVYLFVCLFVRGALLDTRAD